MYCILTKYTVADQTLKFGGSHIFLGGFTAVTKNSANPDIRRRLGRLLMCHMSWRCRHDNAELADGYSQRCLMQSDLISRKTGELTCHISQTAAAAAGCVMRSQCVTSSLSRWQTVLSMTPLSAAAAAGGRSPWIPLPPVPSHHHHHNHHHTSRYHYNSEL